MKNITKEQAYLEYCKQQIERGFVPSLWLHIEDYECALERLNIKSKKSQEDIKDFLFNVELWDFDNFVYYVEEFEQ